MEEDVPCSGNGRCLPFKGCKCDKGFFGEACDSHEPHFCTTEATFCLNDSKCDENRGCQCYNGFYGQRCEKAPASCVEDIIPCNGVGKCDAEKGC